MKKVFIIHGLDSAPNKAWRPWLMKELAKDDLYTCALPMPNPTDPVCNEWVEMIKNTVGNDEEIYLVGHSLGVRAVLKYLETLPGKKIKGVILVSGRFGKPRSGILGSFYNDSLDFEKIKLSSENFLVIHGDNDPNVPYEDGVKLSEHVDCELITIAGGGHLSGGAGYFEFPLLKEVLLKMINE